MKLSSALRDVQRIYIETAPFIYYMEENPTYVKTVDAIIGAIEDTPLQAFSSVITLTEVLNLPIRTGDKALEDEYRDILVNSGSYQLIPVSLTIAERAARLRAIYGLRTPDALHVASAIEARCNVFVTNDIGMRRIQEVAVLILDDLEIEPKQNDRSDE